jgi:hypothetical protein
MNPKYLNLIISLALIFAMIPLKNLKFEYFAPLAVLEIFLFTLVGNWIVEKVSEGKAKE